MHISTRVMTPAQHGNSQNICTYIYARGHTLNTGTCPTPSLPFIELWTAFSGIKIETATGVPQPPECQALLPLHDSTATLTSSFFSSS